jgi:hypothetical protein
VEQDLATLVALGLLASQLTTLFRFVQAAQWSSAFTTVLPWVTAFLALLLGAQAEATSSLTLPGFNESIGDLDIASLFYAAVVVGSTGGFAHKAVKAVDNTQSAAEPPVGLGQAA